MKVDFSAVQTKPNFKSAHISNAEKQNGTTKQNR